MNFEISREVIGCAMKVHRVLGCGFLEGVYENAMAVELIKRGIDYERQVPLSVQYNGVIVGRYFADLVIGHKLLLELKASRTLTRTYESQLLNYLNASNIQTGLLINFGSRSLQHKRMTIAPLTSHSPK
jgi:GxxExxY protein